MAVNGSTAAFDLGIVAFQVLVLGEELRSQSGKGLRFPNQRFEEYS